MLRIIQIFIIGFLLLISWNAHSQRIPVYFRAYNYTSTLPDELLTDRSVAFINVDEENRNRDNWKKVSAQFHGGIVATGTDVIAYYNIEDVFAGLETQRYFSEDLIKRGVKNIIHISKEGINYKMIVTPFNGNHRFMDQGQPAWMVEGGDILQMLSTYRRAVGTSGQKSSNFLMSDVPEFFEDTRMINRARYETFNVDLKLDKLAIPMYPKLKSPPALDGHPDKNKIIAYQQQWERDSTELAQIFKIYPFEYEIIGAEFEEKELRNQGFQFILYSLHTSGRIIHDLLNYKNDKNVTDYITIKESGERNELLTLPANQVVYKFYIKHIFSSELFLGEQWDADITWEAALQNHLAGMRKKVKK